jgi:hypothetical protein
MYVIQWLFEVGPVSFGAMGPTPLEWTDIKAWSDLNSLELEPKEVTALRSLSSAYIDQMEKAKDNACPPPWVDPDQLDRDKIADKVTSQFKAIAKRRNKRSGGSQQDTD